MSDNLLFNWGGRGPEWDAIQRKLEMDAALMEQAIRIKLTQAGQTGGVGGGSQKSTTVETVESEFILVPRLGETNWSYYIADYRNNTLTGPKDTGISRIDYEVSNTYSINNGGYVVLFRLIEDSNDYILFFTDAAGTILDTISGYTSDLLTYQYEGRWFAATDYDERLLWYFDGQTVTSEPDYLQSADDSFNIGATGDSAGADGFCLITNKTNGDVTYCIVGNSGVLELFTNNPSSSDLNYEFRLYNMSGVATLREYNNSTGFYEAIRAFDTATGLQLGSTLDLASGSYADVDTFEYGDGRYLWIFGSATEWQVVTYSKELGFELPDPILKSDYPSYGTTYDNFSLFDFNNKPIHNTFAVYFYESVGSEYDLNVVESYKVVYSIDGAAVQTHTFLEPGDGPLKFRDPSINKGHILFLADTGNGEHSVYTLNSQGVNLFELGTNVSDQSVTSMWRMGEKHGFYINFTANSAKVYVVNSSGTTCTVSDIVGEQVNGFDIDFDAVIVKTLTRKWRVSGSTNQLVEIPFFDVLDISNSYTNPELRRVGILLTTDFQNIVYTHTQMDGIDGEAVLEDFVMDGEVVAGGQYDFGVGSSYFTNAYPGLFVLCAKGINITSFGINGNLGADGDGSTDVYNFTTTHDGTDYAVYVRRVYGAGDPSVNQIIIVNGDGAGITQAASPDTDLDSHSIFGLTSSVTELHYLLLSQDEDIDGGAKIEDSDIEAIVADYLTMAAGVSASSALTALNLGYETITDHVPNLYLFNDSPDSGEANFINDGGGDMYDDGNYLYTNRASTIAKIIKANSITTVSNFANNSENIQIGPTMIGALYFDPSNGMKVSLRIYDHSGNIKYTIKTPHYEASLFDISGNRMILVAGDKTFDGENVYFETTLYTGTVNSYRSVSYNSLDAGGYANIMPNETTWWD